jgi:RES domain
LTSAPQESDFGEYRGTAFRLVEAQHRISTSRLTESIAEEDRLETLIEQAKPPLPETARGLHYLLATPFRYGHRTESRFRRAGERPGIFYASELPRTCLAEMAYWRLRFFAAAPDALLPTTTTEYLMFGVGVAADKALDITRRPFVRSRAQWKSTQSYGACQRFAADARAIGAQLIRYESARDEQAGANVALFDPSCFTSPVPTSQGTWHFRFQGGRLVVIGASPSLERHEYDFGQFGLAHPQKKVAK